MQEYNELAILAEKYQADAFQTARGAILIFLLMQMTSNCSDIPIKVGTSNPWTEYIKFMPAKIPLPTFWNEAERKLLEGTSLKAALEAKLGSLDREFFDLREATRSIEWCMYWWDPDVGRLSFEDWKMVDAIYRSRALDLPGTGHAMVPCIDMANHASGDETVALYDTDSNGNAILVLRDGKNVMSGEEITITYGDEKGACEMVFSYGFLESDLPLPTDEETDLLPRALMAREMFLDIDIPDDDPLKLAKKSAFDAPPGFRLYDRDHDGSIEWEGLFVWLLCVNEEDGLEFHVLQCADGEKELKVSWQGQEIQGIQSLKQCLEKDPLQDVFRLRAVTTLLERIASQLGRLISNGDFVNHAISQVSATYKAWLAYRLAMLEEPFLLVAHQFFLKQVRMTAFTFPSKCLVTDNPYSKKNY